MLLVGRPGIQGFGTCLSSAQNMLLSYLFGYIPVIDSPPPLPNLPPNTRPADLSSFVPVPPTRQTKRPQHTLHKR
jgi:hypothetical protein